MNLKNAVALITAGAADRAAIARRWGPAGAGGDYRASKRRLAAARELGHFRFRRTFPKRRRNADLRRVAEGVRRPDILVNNAGLGIFRTWWT